MAEELPVVLQFLCGVLRSPNSERDFGDSGKI